MSVVVKRGFAWSGTKQRLDLYVVEYALTPERRRIWPIPDPARNVTDFMFDDGWKGLAKPEGGQAGPEVADPVADEA